MKLETSVKRYTLATMKTKHLEMKWNKTILPKDSESEKQIFSYKVFEEW